MDESNFKPAQYCIKFNIWNDRVLYLGDFKMDVIQWLLNLVSCNFVWNHTCDFRPNCTSLSSITIIYQLIVDS